MAQIFSSCNPVITGCFLHTVSTLDNPVSNGKYSNGTTCFTVSGGAGEITASSACNANTEIQVLQTSSGASITDVTDAGSSFITITDGAFPLTAGQDLHGTYTAFTGAIRVVVTGTFSASTLKLYRNGGSPLECQNITTAGTYNFSSYTFAAGDYIQVHMFTGTC